LYHWPSPRPTRLADAVYCWRLFSKLRPDCIITSFGADNLMLLIGAALKVPVRIAWYHTLTSQIDLDEGAPSLIGKLRRFRKKCVYKCATQIVANSAAARADVISAFSVPEDKCRVFGNSLPDPLPVNGEEQPAESATRLLCVGRLQPSKGHDVLIRALPRLRAGFPGCVAEFFGNGSHFDSLRALAESLGVSEMVRFHGEVPHERLMENLRQGGILVHPSRREAFGVAIIEGMALGLPIVASAADGILDLIEHGVSGLLVPPGDEVELASAVTAVLENASMRSQLSMGARARFLKRFEQREVVASQVGWLTTLVRQVPERSSSSRRLATMPTGKRIL
jgi:glycosyltransferase involved in cell wall biosynthesis